MFNAWVDEVKKESVKVQEKYAALLKARGVRTTPSNVLICVRLCEIYNRE